MKYIIMCGGNYTDQFDIPKQLLKVNGEILVERTIRLLKKNGIKDIAIITNCDKFDYLGLPILMQKNKYKHNDQNENKRSECCWLNAYYLVEEPVCYLHGDVYYSDEAIKTIVETKVKDTMFFCVRDIHDGRPAGINTKGREPLAYKVVNYKLFRSAINDLMQMVDDGKFKDLIAPFSWHLYRYINGYNYMTSDLGYINNIFEEKGDYTVIDDYTTDIDFPKDIKELETLLKIMKGGIKMVKVEVTEEFTLGRFNELRNIVRKGQEVAGRLFIGDIFDCTEEMAEYLTKTNKEKRAFVKILEVIPEEKKQEEKEEKLKKVATKKTTKKVI